MSTTPNSEMVDRVAAELCPYAWDCITEAYKDLWRPIARIELGDTFPFAAPPNDPSHVGKQLRDLVAGGGGN